MNLVPGIDKDSKISPGIRMPTIKKYNSTKEKMLDSGVWLLSKDTALVLNNKEEKTKINADNVLRLMGFGSSVNTGIKAFDDHRKEIKDRIISGIESMDNLKLEASFWDDSSMELELASFGINIIDPNHEDGMVRSDLHFFRIYVNKKISSTFWVKSTSEDTKLAYVASSYVFVPRA